MIKQTWYQLPEKDCERLNATEMRSIRWLLGALSICSRAEKDMERRLECIPEGKRRFRLMLGQLRAICNDLIGTTPIKQARTVQTTTHDMELRLVPKLTPGDHNALINGHDLAFLVGYAKDALCTTCIADGDECRKCELYQILESLCPQQDWGGKGLCPYNRDDWQER